jgi:hypothetical protein
MKFRATIVFEFNAETSSEAGRKVDEAVRHARDSHQMDAKAIDVVTPPGSPTVTLPPPPPVQAVGPTPPPRPH